MPKSPKTACRQEPHLSAGRLQKEVDAHLNRCSKPVQFSRLRPALPCSRAEEYAKLDAMGEENMQNQINAAKNAAGAKGNALLRKLFGYGFCAVFLLVFAGNLWSVFPLERANPLLSLLLTALVAAAGFGTVRMLRGVRVEDPRRYEILLRPSLPRDGISASSARRRAAGRCTDIRGTTISTTGPTTHPTLSFWAAISSSAPR